MKTLTAAVLKKTVGALGYKWYGDRPNLIGIRRETQVPDTFNDVFVAVFMQPVRPANILTTLDRQVWLNYYGFVGENGVALVEDGKPGKNTAFAEAAYKAVAGKERLLAWACTTVPGVFYLTTPVEGGCAVLVPGQYVNTYKLGKHREGKPGEQAALVQQGAKVTVYRDNDKDNLAEETERTSTGWFGINIHRALATGTTKKIWNWSAGCQVFANFDDHALLLRICEAFETRTKNLFTYTLLRETELV